jgi:hypothetical protein
MKKIIAGFIALALLSGVAVAQTTITTTTTPSTRNTTIDRTQGLSRSDYFRAECLQRLQNDRDHNWGGGIHMNALCACAAVTLENNLKAGQNGTNLSNAIGYCATALE